MRPPLVAPILALVLGVLAAFAVACGQDTKGLIGPVNAERLKADLNDLDQAVAAGKCDRVDAELASLRSRVEGLPRSTDSALRSRLEQGVANLERQAPEECTGHTTPETTPQTTPETTPQTTPETTPQTTPETTPQTTPETTPQTTPETTPQTTPETTPQTTPAPPGQSTGDTGSTPPGQGGTPPGQSGGEQAPTTTGQG